MDAIDRQAAIDAATHGNPQTAWQRIEALPSVQPERVCVAEVKVSGEELQQCVDRAVERLKEEGRTDRWIPCSERLPEDDELMLVNYIDRRPDAMDIWIGWHEMENVWYIDGEAHSAEYGNEVIAWMPLPEPYKGEQE